MWRNLKRFLSAYVAPRKATFASVQLAHIAAAAMLLAPPLLIRSIIDDAIPGSDYRRLLILGAAILAIYIVWAVISALKEYWGHEVAQRATVAVRNDLYDHFQKLSMTFHDNRKTGELLSRIVDDINIVQEFVHHGPETLFGSSILLVGSAAVMFVMDWRLALVGLALVPVLGVFAHRMGYRLWQEFREVRKRVASLTEVLEENLTGVHIIKAFLGEARSLDAVSAQSEGHYKSRMRVIRYVSLLFPGSLLINSAAVVLVLAYGGALVIQDKVTIGTLTVFILLLRRFLQPIIHLVMMSEQGGRFFASLERIFEYMDIEPETEDHPRCVPMGAVQGEVRFEGVSFKYDREPVLHGVSLVAQAGQMVALVGPSGAGKTTILNLIPRFYEPYAGKVLIDGKDIQDVRLRELRSHIGMVVQDDFLFSGTVAANIAYGRPDAAFEEIAAAAEGANAASFIETLPQRYDTEIGKRGVKLSEGQRQRLSIARALLKGPQILLLDEATSSVDTETEQLIQQAIERLRAGRTTFVIAHRLSTILQAERILFVQQGRIIERGTHAALMARDGEYARFYRLQFSSLNEQ